MRSSRAQFGVLALTLLGYAYLLGRPLPEASRSAVDGLLDSIVLVLVVLILLRRGEELPEHRSWLRLLAYAVCAFLIGELLSRYLGDPSQARGLSPADVGYLACYPLLLGGMLLALRQHLSGMRLMVTLDGLTGMLAGTAAVSLAVGPLVSAVWDGSWRAAVTLAHPLADAVLVAAGLGALGVLGSNHARQFLTWTLGIVVFCGADVIDSYRSAFSGYEPAAWTGALPALGLGLVALGATAMGTATRRGVPGAGSLGVVAVSSVVAVGVLAGAPPWQQSFVPSVLALLTLVVCSVRLLLAFFGLRELAVMREQALTDELTGISNRRALYVHLDRRFGMEGDSGRRVDHSGTTDLQTGFAMALIDLNHFKEVNDSYGHAAGDQLLKAVVDRFSQALTDLETPHLLARLGGDEFAIVLHEATTRTAAEIVGEALHESLGEPIELDEVVLHAQASIGLALAPEHGATRGDILFAADAAMYAAKTSGEPICFHSPAAVGDRRQRLTVAEDLYSALERHELTVAYQPIVTASGSMVAAEALVRWDHPSRGRLTPGEFLEAAERYRLTQAIAERVLDVTMADLARWRADGVPLTASVNLSASDLRDEGIVDLTASALLAHQIPPELLTIEITETAMMHDADRAQAVMHAFHDLGVRLAVDDYGTGYSSLEYLLKLPISLLKLDKTFSANLGRDPKAQAIVRSTVDLTHALGLEMIAEGVEDEASLQVLLELGCDMVQGLARRAPDDGARPRDADVQAGRAQAPRARRALSPAVGR